MGGSIAVTVRKQNGRVVKMLRWTNALPYWLTNLRLTHDDDCLLDEYIADWSLMGLDYEKHKDDRQFEFPMTTA
jgi:hypothetical protein